MQCRVVPSFIEGSVTRVSHGDACQSRWRMSVSVTRVRLGDTCQSRWHVSGSVTRVTLGDTCHARWHVSCCAVVHRRLGDTCQARWHVSCCAVVHRRVGDTMDRCSSLMSVSCSWCCCPVFYFVNPFSLYPMIPISCKIDHVFLFQSLCYSVTHLITPLYPYQ